MNNFLPNSSWTVRELQDELRRRNIPFSTSLNKNSLLELLNRVRNDTPDVSWTRSELIDEANRRNIPFFENDNGRRLLSRLQGSQRTLMRAPTTLGAPNLSWRAQELKDELTRRNIPYRSSDTKSQLLNCFNLPPEERNSTPNVRWSKQQLQTELNRQGIQYRAGDTKRQLMDRLNGTSNRPVAPQRLNTGDIPNIDWTKSQLQARLTLNNIRYSPSDTKIELLQLLDQFSNEAVIVPDPSTVRQRNRSRIPESSNSSQNMTFSQEDMNAITNHLMNLGLVSSFHRIARSPMRSDMVNSNNNVITLPGTNRQINLDFILNRRL
jgi:predicted HTH domain antitoxin